MTTTPAAEPAVAKVEFDDLRNDGAAKGGHTVRWINVAELDFALLRSREDWERGEPPSAIKACQEDIRWADHLVFIFPLWLGGLPALFKGFLEQTLRPDLPSAEARADFPADYSRGAAPAS